MWIMGKKIVLFIMVTYIMACPVANAQIGVTQKGVVLCYHWWFPDYSSSSDFDVFFRGSFAYDKIPVYLDGTKSVKLRYYPLSYDRVTDTWERGISDSNLVTIIEFDSLGRISKYYYYVIKKDRNDTNYIETYEFVKGKINKIEMKFLDDSNRLLFRYDNNGNLKTAFSGEFQWDFIYSPKGVISQIRKLESGYERYASPYIFKYTTNGYSIIIKKDSDQDKYYWQIDKHGNSIKYTSPTTPPSLPNKEFEQQYYENTYDENSNLIKRLHYDMRDVGKYYTEGTEIEYEYIYE